MSHSTKLAALALAFSIGLLIPSPFFGNNEPPVRNDAPGISTRSHPRQILPERSGSTPRTAGSPSHHQSDTVRRLDLQVEVVEALIKGKGMERMLKQMKVAEEDIQTILKIQKKAAENLKALEARHATLRSDEEGEYFEIPAFPEDHAAWVDAIERDLAPIFGDDRSAVISRIIVQQDNDEQTGLYFRKVRPIFKENSIVIRESVYEKGPQGFGLIDEDYRIHRGAHENRWEHLFTPETLPPGE